MSGEEPTDTDLMRELSAGREAAFVELYRRRRGDVYRFSYAMSKSAAVAQDVTQDVFLALLERGAKFDPGKGSVRAWLLGCARHAVLDRLRADGRWVAAADVEVDARPAAVSAEDDALAAQRLERLHAAILTLPIEYREALVLCELEELSYAECAAVLGCPIGTVRSRLHRARTLLAERLEGPAADRAAPLLKTSEVC